MWFGLCVARPGSEPGHSIVDRRSWIFRRSLRMHERTGGNPGIGFRRIPPETTHLTAHETAGIMNTEPRVVAKHRLLVQEDGQQQVHVCDVHSWNDSVNVEHGISGKLEVTTRRFTPSKTITDYPRFRLTLSSKADSSGLLAPFLNRLRSTRQVWWSYLVWYMILSTYIYGLPVSSPAYLSIRPVFPACFTIFVHISKRSVPGPN